MLKMLKKYMSKIIIGSFISAICIYLLVKIVDNFDETISSLNSISIRYITIGVGIYFLSLFLRTLRWKILLESRIKIDYKSLYKVIVAGYMFNNILPARLGEIARIYHLNLIKNVNKSFALGTVLSERITDVLALMIFLIIGFIYIPNDVVANLATNSETSITIIYTSVIFLLILILIFILLIITGFWKYILAVLTKLFEKLTFGKFNSLLLVESFTRGVFSIKSYDLFKIITLAIGLWAIEFSMFFFIALQFNMDIDNLFIAILFFGILSNLAGIIPSTSGGWGPFELVGTITLTSFGVSSGVAMAFTILVHLILWLPISIIGILIFLIDLKKVKE